MNEKKTWLDYRRPDYVDHQQGWVFATDHYTSQVINKANIRKYLPKRIQSEHEDAYQSRLAGADYTPYYAHAVDTLAGMFFAVEGKADRRWSDDAGNGLGAPGVPNTVADQLSKDADGNGTSYTTIWKQLAIELNYISCSWLAVEGKGSKEGGKPAHVSIKNIPALAVVNWHINPDTGLIDAVLVTEDVVVADDIFTEPTTQTQYLLYELTGWQRYAKDEHGDPVKMTGLGDTGTYTYVDRQGRAILPIYPVSMPMARNLGEVLAHKANKILQQQSYLDHILSVSTMPKLVLPASDEQVDMVTDGLIQGSNLIPIDPDSASHPGYISAPVEGAKILHEILKEKVAAFYEVFFQVYGEAARTRTATEVMQDVAAGVGAYLQLQKDAVDDAENKALDLVAQAAYTTSKDNWFIAHVERNDDFTPVNIKSIIDEMIKQIFGGTTQVPVGPLGRLETIKMLAAVRGITVDVDEVRNEIMISDMMNYQPLIGSFAIPPEAQTELTMAFLANMGLFSDNADEDGDNDTVVKTLDPATIRAAIMAQATQSQLQKLAPSPAAPGGPTTIGGQSGTQGNHAAATAQGKATAGTVAGIKPGQNAPSGGLKSEGQMAINNGDKLTNS